MNFTGINFPEPLVEIITLFVFFIAFVVSIIFNIKDNLKKPIISYTDFCRNGLVCGTTIKKEGFNFAIHTAENETEMKWINKNRKWLLKYCKFSNLVTLKQVHSDKILLITRDNLRSFVENPLIEGDGLLTNLKDILIGVLTADCVPLFYTCKNRAFCGIVHAGWKGINQKIHIKMLEKIKNNFNTAPDQIEILIGPHIRKCCYEIGKELIEELQAALYETRNDKFFLDMESMIISDLIRHNIKKEKIISYPACTKCGKNPAFYSYRNGERKGRNLSFIGLKPTPFPSIFYL